MIIKPEEKAISDLLRSQIFMAFGLDILNYEIVYYKSEKGYAAFTDFSRIYINELMIDNKKNNLLTFFLLHEVLHLIFYHDKRLGSKDKFVWQFATDFMINLFIFNLCQESKEKESNIIDLPWNEITKKFLFDENFNNMLEEDIYEKLKNNKYKKETKTKPLKEFFKEIGLPCDKDCKGDVEITKTSFEHNGKKYQNVDVKLPESDLTDEQMKKLKERINLSRTMIQNSLLSRGLDSQLFQKFLKKIFKVKVDWKIILADSILTELQKSPEMEWSSPRLSWMVNPTLPYLPNYSDTEKYGTLICSLDESGSMEDNTVRKAISIIQQSKEFYKNIYVIKHDVNTFTKLYDNISEIEINELLQRRHCGGTSHEKVFQEILKFSKTNDTFISLCIFITDMCSDIESTQNIISTNIPRIYLVPKKETKYEKIIGKVIEIK